MTLYATGACGSARPSVFLLFATNAANPPPDCGTFCFRQYRRRMCFVRDRRKKKEEEEETEEEEDGEEEEEE